MPKAFWTPLLEGRQRAQAQEIVREIVTDVRRAIESRPGLDRSHGYDPFVAVLFAEAGRALGDGALLQKSLDILDAAVAELESSVLSPALYGGICGVGWLNTWLPAFLQPGGTETSGGPPSSDVDTEDPGEAIDVALAAALQESRWDQEYDLISGLVGFGVYALERLPHPSAAEVLRLVVAQLAATAVDDGDGITWFTPPHRLPAHQRAEAPAGYFNLGMAHGVPGVIGLLGRIWGAGVAAEQCLRLLEPAVAWLVSQGLPEGDGARFPSWRAPGVERPLARTAWCYGGLGLSAGLMAAAANARRASWEAEAIRIARAEAARPVGQTRVADACLCHGAAGNAHIFARLASTTGDQSLGEAARFWYGRAIEMRTPGQGFGGYRFWGRLDPAQPDSEMGFADDLSFLSGSAGVALALIAATVDTEPSWDRLLLVQAR